MLVIDWTPAETQQWLMQVNSDFFSGKGWTGSVAQLSGSQLLGLRREQFQQVAGSDVLWEQLLLLKRQAEHESLLLALELYSQGDVASDDGKSDDQFMAAIKIQKEYWDQTQAYLRDEACAATAAERFRELTRTEEADRKLSLRLQNEQRHEESSYQLALKLEQHRLDGDFARHMSRVGAGPQGDAMQGEVVSGWEHIQDIEKGDTATDIQPDVSAPSQFSAGAFQHNTQDDSKAGARTVEDVANISISTEDIKQDLSSDVGRINPLPIASPPATESNDEWRRGVCLACREHGKVVPLGCDAGHEVCKACFRTLCRTALQDRSLLPLRCCNTRLDLMLCAKVLEEYELVLLVQRTREVTCERSMHCSSCNAFIDLTWFPTPSPAATGASAQGKESMFECAACGAMLCHSCKTAAHVGITCSDNIEQVRKAQEGALCSLADQKGWQRCSSCQTFVELREGCNHMICLCNYEFCYECGMKWRTCSCDIWQERNILVEAERRVDRQHEMENVQERAAAVAREVQHIRHQNALGHECFHNTRIYDEFGRRRRQFGRECDNCDFHMWMYQYECSECGRGFCHVCHFHRRLR